MRQNDEIAAILDQHGVILRKEHPRLSRSLQRRVQTGELVAILPGVYTVPERNRDLMTMVVGLHRAHPETVFTGSTAARLSYWPEVRWSGISATTGRTRVQPPRLVWERRRIPPDLIMVCGGLNLTVPSLTALDMSDLDHTEALDVALRKRVVTVDSLREALRLTPYRRGNASRWAVVLDSRSGGWSYPERVAHRLLRAARITGWVANHPFRSDAGDRYFIDIAFERARLAVEIDGRIHATDLGVFESDRWRQNALVGAGWRVLRFTYAMVIDHPETFISTIRAALES